MWWGDGVSLRSPGASSHLCSRLCEDSVTDRVCQVKIYLFCQQTKQIYLVIFTYCLLKTLIVEQKTFTLLTSLAAMPGLCRRMTIAGHWSHFIWLFVSDLTHVNGHSCGLQGPATSVCIFWPALTLTAPLCHGRMEPFNFSLHWVEHGLLTYF